MDPLTHALSGALLVRAVTPFSQQHRASLPLYIKIRAGFAAAVFPDLDIVLRLIDTLIYLTWHQGPTHSLLMLPIWAWLLAQLFSYFSGRKYHWQVFYLPVCLGLTIHILGDLITSFGLMLFAPFSTQRFFLPLAFVIDPWFSGIIIVGLVVSWIFPRQRIVAMISVFCLIGYVMFLWAQHNRAMVIGQEYVDTQSLDNAVVSVLPQPLSPFNWKIIVKDNQFYHVALIDLWGKKSMLWQDSGAGLLNKMNAAYQPLVKVSWQYLEQFGNWPNESTFVQEVWNHPDFANFRDFSSFPLLQHFDNFEEEECLWFFDQRFEFPELSPFFRFGMCRIRNTSDWILKRQPDSFSWIRTLLS